MLGKIFKKIMWKFWSNDQRIDYMRKKGVTIGENCEIYKNVVFGTEPYLITIGDNVRLTSNVQFVTHDGSMWVLRKQKRVSESTYLFGEIKIGNNVNIGWNTVIMPGVEIGDNCIIGIGAIVTKDIPSNCVAAGVPAIVIESVDEYYSKNKQKFTDLKNVDDTQKQEYILAELSKRNK